MKVFNHREECRPLKKRKEKKREILFFPLLSLYWSTSIFKFCKITGMWFRYYQNLEIIFWGPSHMTSLHETTPSTPLLLDYMAQSKMFPNIFMTTLAQWLPWDHTSYRMERVGKTAEGSLPRLFATTPSASTASFLNYCVFLLPLLPVRFHAGLSSPANLFSCIPWFFPPNCRVRTYGH